MFLDDTQKQNGAASHNEPPAGGSTGGAAPGIRKADGAESSNVAPTETTPVSASPLTEEKVRVIAIDAVTQHLAANPPTPPTLGKAEQEQLVSDCEAVAVAKATQISEQAKNDTILGVNMLLKPILDWFKEKRVAPPQAAATGDPGAPAVPRAIVEGDQVKVWTDAVKKTFILGSVETVHDAAHSFDVLLEDGTVAHVQAGNLALDDLAH